MSLVLLKRITDKAEKTYTGPEIMDGHMLRQYWYPHWFQTAAAIRDEFKREDLPNTVKEVERIIEEQQRICQYVWLPPIQSLKEFEAEVAQVTGIPARIVQGA